MSDYSTNNGFDDILKRLLDRIPDNVDKRQGSIIYDALAPAAAEIAQCYIALDVYTDQTYLLKAVGENLDNRVADYGLKRLPATFAKRAVEVHDTNGELMNLELGTRFSIPNSYGGNNFKIIESTSLGHYIAECESGGATGNDYIGELLPLNSINNLGTAVLQAVIKPGEDEETDDELRKRALAKINQEAFAGNKAAYKLKIESIDGVESCKVFPVWNGGGTVKLAIIASDNKIPSSEFIQKLQTLIDPIQNQGQGIGLAPIGHSVTVVAPDKLDINISATITTDENYSVEQLRPSIEKCIKDYLTEVQNAWANEDTLIIYTSRLIAAILSVSQVTNVTNLKLNSQPTDLIIKLTGTNVKFPILNEVILNEA